MRRNRIETAFPELACGLLQARGNAFERLIPETPLDAIVHHVGVSQRESVSKLSADVHKDSFVLRREKFDL